ncbi:MAG: hypothetical protein IKY98_05635 [Alphaproteobacteria bacterium]|nr:hypothetical protein [Alphaproteobacteria bacterium]
MKKILDKSYFQRTNRGQNGESGRSLIEMLGTIAIITVITIGSIAAGGVAMTTWRTSELRNDLDVMMQTIVDLYSWKRDGFPIEENEETEDDAIKNFFCKEDKFYRCVCDKEEDKNCDSDTYRLLSPWGKEVSIYSTNGDDLNIYVVGVPVMACRQLDGAEGTYWKHLTTHSSRGTCPDRGVVDMTFKLKETF